jgi:hypothetical protein
MNKSAFLSNHIASSEYDLLVTVEMWYCSASCPEVVASMPLNKPTYVYHPLLTC